MKNIKKIVILALAIVMCITSLSVMSFAEGYDPGVKILTSYDDLGNTIIASVATEQKAGAIKATFAYAGSITINPAGVKLIENVSVNEACQVDGNKITFILVTDKAEGENLWATVPFTLNAEITEDVTFSLTAIEVCDVKAAELGNWISIPDKKLTITSNKLRALGAQYRQKDADTYASDDSLRFGTKLFRTKGTNAIVGGTAVSCGYVLGFEFNITAKNGSLPDELTVTLDGSTPKAVANGSFVKQASKGLEFADDYLIYAYAINGFYDDEGNPKKSGEHILADEKVRATPYVVYQKEDGTYDVAYGQTISKSYNEVKAICELNESGSQG